MKKGQIRKVLQENGLNYVEANGTRTYIPSDLSLSNVVYINGEPYIETVIVSISI